MSNPNVAVYPNALPVDQTLTVVSDSSVAVLTSALGSTDTSMNVSQVYNVPCLLSIDNEVIYAQGVNGNIYTNLVRGFNNTSPAAHTSGSNVFGYIFSYTINQISAEVKAICQTLGTNLSNLQLCSVGVFNGQTSITVTHNLNTEVVSVQFWDSQNNLIQPLTLKITDANTVTATFSTSTSGSVYVFGAKKSQSASVTGTTQGGGGTNTNLVFGGQAFVNQTQISIPHNLSTSKLIFQAYDSTNLAFETGNFVVTDNNNATLRFATSQSGRAVVCGDTVSASQLFTNTTSVTFAHNLSTLNVMVNTFDNTNTQFEPDVVQIVDLNTVTVTFDVTQSGSIIVLGNVQFAYTIPQAGTTFNIRHNLNTQNLCFQCYDTNGLMFDADTFTIVDSNNVTITFTNPQTGKVLLKA